MQPLRYHLRSRIVQIRLFIRASSGGRSRPNPETVRNNRRCERFTEAGPECRDCVLYGEAVLNLLLWYA